MLGIRLTFNLSILCNRLLSRNNNREAQVMERTMENSNTQNLLQLHVQAAMQLANLCNMGNCPTFPANAVWPYPAQSNCHKSVPGLNGSLTLTENGDLVAAKQPCSPQLLLSALAPLHNLQPKSPQKKGILEKGLSLSSENNVHELRASERTSKRPVANKQGVKRPKRSRTEWSKREIIVLLQCARLMSDCELKTIVRVVYSYTKRLPGKCWGRAAEKKLKRLVNFRSWKTCDKNEVLRQVELRLRELGAEHEKIDPKLKELIQFYTNRNRAATTDKSG